MGSHDQTYEDKGQQYFEIKHSSLQDLHLKRVLFLSRFNVDIHKKLCQNSIPICASLSGCTGESSLDKTVEWETEWTNMGRSSGFLFNVWKHEY